MRRAATEFKLKNSFNFIIERKAETKHLCAAWSDSSICDRSEFHRGCIMDANSEDTPSRENSKPVKQGGEDGHTVAEHKSKSDSRENSEKAPSDQHKSPKPAKETSEKEVHSSKKSSESHSESGKNKSSEEKKSHSSSTEKESNSFKRGSLVWVHIKGFPWWPGLVVKEADIPDDKKKVQPCYLLCGGAALKASFVLNCILGAFILCTNRSSGLLAEFCIARNEVYMNYSNLNETFGLFSARREHCRALSRFAQYVKIVNYFVSSLTDHHL
jgi:DNA mismatch repair ATPase MutL